MEANIRAAAENRINPETFIIEAAHGRHRALLATACFTGLRASELRGLRWVDVELEGVEAGRLGGLHVDSQVELRARRREGWRLPGIRMNQNRFDLHADATRALAKLGSELLRG